MNVSKTTDPRRAKIGIKSVEARKVVIILGASVAIYLGGWLFFYAVVNWETKSGTVRYSPPVPAVEVTATSTVPENAEVHVERPAAQGSGEPPLEIISESDRTDPQTHIPAGNIPPGVRVGDAVSSVKCWNNAGLQTKGDACSDVRGLLRFVEDRIYLFVQCKRELVGERLLGRLDLGVEFDFGRESLSFWNTPSSTLRGSSEIVACAKEAVLGISLQELEPTFDRYQVAFSVWFEGLGKRTAAAKTSEQSQTTGESGSPRKTVDFPTGRFEDGRFVLVTRDRVRIREKPVDGHMLGKISTGSRVLLLEQQEEWCRVRTRRGNVGWMVCWALDLR